MESGLDNPREWQSMAVQGTVGLLVGLVTPRHTRSPLLGSGAARGREGEASPLWVDVQKLCNMSVLSLSWNFFYHTTNTLQGRRAKSHVDTQTIQPGLGDFVL